jgi:type II secretory ATPase GspE/PulE/Tfp pilus assembly ATPase PilB-like protein
MLDYRNEKTRGHIITIEDPIEYVHAHKNCVVTQREVGVDTDSWHMALKNTLRQAPDVILIGEIRDRDTMEYGIQFAETGHLVLATLHANSANQALDRIINFFPEDRREQLLMDLSLNIRAMVSQRLDAARRRQGPHCRHGGHAQYAIGGRPDIPWRGVRDQGDHGQVQPARHEDLRPGAVRAIRRQDHFVRGGLAQRRLQERDPAAHQARKQASGQES